MTDWLNPPQLWALPGDRGPRECGWRLWFREVSTITGPWRARFQPADRSGAVELARDARGVTYARGASGQVVRVGRLVKEVAA